LSTAKTGKHGAAKASITGIDIFTNKKHEETISTAASADVPIVVRTEYSLIDIAEDGFVTLMLDDGSTKEDLKLPTDEDSQEVNNVIIILETKSGIDGWKDQEGIRRW